MGSMRKYDNFSVIWQELVKKYSRGNTRLMPILSGKTKNNNNKTTKKNSGEICQSLILILRII